MRMRVQAMVQIMTAMLKADDHTCLMLYIKSRQKAVTALLQAASASGGGQCPQVQRSIARYRSASLHHLPRPCSAIVTLTNRVCV